MGTPVEHSPRRMEDVGKVNFRVAGRLPQGKIAKAATAVDSQPSRPSIPSKLETILYKGDREALGFGSKDLRFVIGENGEAPGPGQYGQGKGCADILSQSESWSKRGTGTFASVTRRFPHARLSGGPGPGAYGLPLKIGAEQMPSSAFAQKLDLPPRTGGKNAAPGPGEYVLKEQGHGGNAGVGFKSRSKQRDFATVERCANTPGPGQYALRSKSAPAQQAPRDCRAAFALPTSKAQSFVRAHPDLPPARPEIDPDGDFYKPRVPVAPSPGPGQYSPVDALNEYTACVKGNSAFVEGSSHLSRKPPVEYPGPGQYSLPSTLEGERGAAAAFKWQGQRGAGIRKSAAPGPAYYDQDLPDQHKSFHLNIRRKWV